VKVDSFALAGVELKSVPADLSRPGQGAFSKDSLAGNIGSELLRRFTVTFDYPNKCVYFTPNIALNEPFPASRGGLSISLENGQQIVVDVVKGGPADEAGVRLGDIVLGANGKAITKTDPRELRSLFRQDAGKTVELIIRTGTEKPRTAKLTLRDLY
jgi:S1-C subfamily serine protease